MEIGEKVEYQHESGPRRAEVVRIRGGNRVDLMADGLGHVQFVPIGGATGCATPADWPPAAAPAAELAAADTAAIAVPTPRPLPALTLWHVAALAASSSALGAVVSALVTWALMVK